MNELGEEHMHTGKWIIYTSGDSVFQIEAHVEVVPLEELYRACEIARELCNPYKVGRVIARPFRGKPGAFERTADRRDYAYKHDEPTVLERLHDAGIPVCAVGKIEDIFAHRGITRTVHTGTTKTSEAAMVEFTETLDHGLIFANFIDFDQLYGHRRDPKGYAGALEQTDAWLGEYIRRLRPEDLLMITADHGNDPTFKGTDHTREFVPLLAYRPGYKGRSLGIRKGFYDLGQTLIDFFGLPPQRRGKSFLVL